MAKLSARGRREYVRVLRRDVEPDGVWEAQRAYMSDGVILSRSRYADQPWPKWHVDGQWDRVRVSVPMLREGMRAAGWQIVGAA